jgi:hypothetical protein
MSDDGVTIIARLRENSPPVLNEKEETTLYPRESSTRDTKGSVWRHLKRQGGLERRWCMRRREFSQFRGTDTDAGAR